MTILAILALIGAVVSAWFFRKGGIYNPKMPSFDTQPPEEPFIPASPPPIMAPTATTSPATAFPSETAPLSQPKATIANFCLALKDYEGWILPGGKDWSGKVYPKGSRSYQNCSPGNVRYFDGGYLHKYLPVLRDKDNFAVFKDYATGWLYLNEMVKAKIHLHPNQTILQFMEVYAPKSENDPIKYAKFIGKRLGVDISFVVKNLV